MKKVAVLLLCLIFVSCTNQLADVKTGEEYITPTLYFGNKIAAVDDLFFEEDSVHLPLMKILVYLGANYGRDLRFDSYDIDDYNRWCWEIQGQQYVIDWENKLFIPLEDFIQLSDRLKENGEVINAENAQAYTMLPETASQTNGEEYVYWAAREIVIGNAAFVRLAEQLGIQLSVTWDYDSRTVYIDHDIVRGDILGCQDEHKGTVLLGVSRGRFS